MIKLKPTSRGFTPTPQRNAFGVSSDKMSERGFTLIELLVVISIIGLLASVVLVSLNSARSKSRAARRSADIKQLQTAIEMYYDSNGQYPSTGGSWRSQCAGWGSYASDLVIPNLVPTYVSRIPSDPAMNSVTNQNCYLYISNGTEYKFMAYNLTDMVLADINKFMNLKDPVRNDAGNICGWIDSALALAVFSPNGKCY